MWAAGLSNKSLMILLGPSNSNGYALRFRLPGSFVGNRSGPLWQQWEHKFRNSQFDTSVQFPNESSKKNCRWAADELRDWKQVRIENSRLKLKSIICPTIPNHNHGNQQSAQFRWSRAECCSSALQRSPHFTSQFLPDLLFPLHASRHGTGQAGKPLRRFRPRAQFCTQKCLGIAYTLHAQERW